MLSILGLIAATAGALAPLIIGFFPRLGPWPLYRLSAWRTALGLAGVALAVASFVRRPSRGRLVAVSVAAQLAGLANWLRPQLIFAALDYPPNLPADEAGLADRALVLGVEWQGHARAWPLEMVAPHHLVNDRLGSTPILVSY